MNPNLKNDIDFLYEQRRKEGFKSKYKFSVDMWGTHTIPRNQEKMDFIRGEHYSRNNLWWAVYSDEVLKNYIILGYVPSYLIRFSGQKDYLELCNTVLFYIENKLRNERPGGCLHDIVRFQSNNIYLSCIRNQVNIKNYPDLDNT